MYCDLILPTHLFVFARKLLLAFFAPPEGGCTGPLFPYKLPINLSSVFADYLSKRVKCTSATWWRPFIMRISFLCEALSDNQLHCQGGATSSLSSAGLQLRLRIGKHTQWDRAEALWCGHEGIAIRGLILCISSVRDRFGKCNQNAANLVRWCL